MNIGIDPSYFSVKQGNMGFWFIKYYQVLYQLFSTAFDQHEIQLRASFMSNLREISQRAVVKRLLRKAGNADGVSRAIASRFSDFLGKYLKYLKVS